MHAECSAKCRAMHEEEAPGSFQRASEARLLPSFCSDKSNRLDSAVCDFAALNVHLPTTRRKD